MGVEISVVIPVYNEEENVGPCYDEIVDALSPLKSEFEIIFVDDGSSDSTFTTLERLSKKDSRLKVLKLRKNFGQSAALKAGLDYASGDIIATMDGDLQNDPADIPEMIETLNREDCDVVCGWRYNRKDTFSKKIVSKFANFLRKNITGEKIHDSGCTLRVYISESAKSLELYGELHRYIPAMLSWNGYKISEMKTNHRERKYGRTKYKWDRLVKGYLDLLLISFWQRYSMRPMHIFGGCGLVMFSIGSFITLYMTILRLFFGESLSDRPLFLGGLFMILIGVQFVATGILADIVSKIYYGQNERKSYNVERIL
ncbi:MAG: glycosyltransferase family 2 protein [Methanolobus sp.]